MDTELDQYLNPMDVEQLRAAFRSASPFPFVRIDNLFRDSFASEVAAAFPTFESARRKGHEFRRVNESRKVQITDVGLFPEPVRTLHQILASPDWLRIVSGITGISGLLCDSEQTGGGIHVYGPGAHLDVHVDFNRVAESRLFRRLNLLVFFNPYWGDEWGGRLELWSPDVSRLEHSILPEMNRCVIFATSETSYHGVSKVTCPSDISRNSFAGYYYTAEPPSDWDGNNHSTVFRPRPGEHFKGAVLMPLERIMRAPSARFRTLSRILRRNRS